MREPCSWKSPVTKTGIRPQDNTRSGIRRARMSSVEFDNRYETAIQLARCTSCWQM